MRVTRPWISALLIFGTAACSTTVGRLDPRPSVALVPQPASLELAFDLAVPERFDLEVGGHTVHVESWRASLETGFRNAFRGAYSAAQGATADWTLQIDEARLELGDFDHKQARVRYSATLRAADGTIHRTSGIASRAAPTFEGGTATTSYLLARDVSASIEAMYEQLARELLTAGAPSSSTGPKPAAAGCVPGQSIACVGSKGCPGFQVCANDGARFEACSCD